MPIFDMYCECGNEVEKWTKVFKEPVMKCKKCGLRMKRRWSKSNFHLKGEGWGKHGYVKESEIADHELGPVDKGEWA